MGFPELRLAALAAALSALGCERDLPPLPPRPTPPPRQLTEEEKRGLTPGQIAIYSEGPTEVPALPPRPYKHVAGPAWEALLAADRKSIRLYHLEPGPYPPRDTGFHGHTIVKEGRARDATPVVATLVSAVEHQTVAATCFAPHHGIRVRGAKATYDFVICFSCRNIQIYSGDEAIAYAITDNVITAMDEAFRRNGL